MPVNHEKILENFREGKENALKQLYDCFFVPLCSYAYRFVEDETLVKDIVQEIFIKLWNKRADFYAVFSLRAFLYTSVRNACLNELRAQKRRKRIPITEDVGNVEENWLIEEEVHRMITSEIEALPFAMRKVFELTLLDLSVKEIAETLKISENTVKNQKFVARKKLQKKLKNFIFFLFL